MQQTFAVDYILADSILTLFNLESRVAGDFKEGAAPRPQQRHAFGVTNQDTWFSGISQILSGLPDIEGIGNALRDLELSFRAFCDCFDARGNRRLYDELFEKVNTSIDRGQDLPYGLTSGQMRQTISLVDKILSIRA